VAITAAEHSGRNSILPRPAIDAADRPKPAQILEIAAPSVAVLHADSDERLVELWLHGRNQSRPTHTGPTLPPFASAVELRCAW
jgi:hypothetical protein